MPLLFFIPFSKGHDHLNQQTCPVFTQVIVAGRFFSLCKRVFEGLGCICESPYPSRPQCQPQFPCTYGQQSYPPNQGQQPSKVLDDDPDENPNPQPVSAIPLAQPHIVGAWSASSTCHQPSSPSAPPLKELDQFSGYGNMDGTPLQPPPSYNEALHLPPPQSQDITTTVPVISEEQARTALFNHVSQKCCFGSKLANKMKFTNILPSSAFHYSLESYTEKRSTKWAYETYQGQVIDGSSNGTAPSPWDIEARPPPLFQSHTVNMEVPHTASIKRCRDCIGTGRKQCHNCHGRGTTRCSSCYGRGHCQFCNGDGRERCSICNGHGKTECLTCYARGQVKRFIRLTIEWIVHHDDHVVDRSSLPNELIRTVSGETVFKQELPRVCPINHFPDVDINEASKDLVQRHLTGFQAERMIMQRQKVRAVPVANIHCQWKNNNFSYFVYGFEHKVHAPDYPQQCCCGCTLL
ncbi:protein SSUH2 homolog [Saccoglossus kowalevskii]